MANKVDFDDYTTDYNKLLKEGTNFFTSREEYFAQYKVDIVRQRVSSPVNQLLEYGCGIGRNIPFLQRAFPDAAITGSDISHASLEIAQRENVGAEFFQENENLEAELAHPFDLIFVAGVFHHIPVAQRLNVAKKLFDRLSPGGLLFVFEHNPFNPVTRRIVNNCPYDEDAVLLNPSELRKTLSAAGLVVERKAYCLFVPPNFSALTKMETKLGWLPLGGQYWIQARRPA